jgi:hypothetical protein
MTTEIHVVGYPRSGTVWLTRLMSDLLDSPIATLNNPPSEYQRKILELKPIAYALFDTLNTDFCETGTGGYQIIKVHLPARQWTGKGKVIFIPKRLFAQRVMSGCIDTINTSCLMFYWAWDCHTILSG